MTHEELSDAMIGLFAYDTGCVDSGISDPLLKRRVIEHLNGLSATDYRLLISRIAREQFLTEEALARQYGLEDAHHFYEWLDDLG